MNKILIPLLICSTTLFASTATNYSSTLSAVIIAGGIIKAQHSDIVKKYKRQDCPVCKGKGWYMSGDNISKVDCGYCEVDTKLEIEPKIIVDPPHQNSNKLKKYHR